MSTITMASGPILLRREGFGTGGEEDGRIFRRVVHFQAKQWLAIYTNLVDSSGGTASGASALPQVAAVVGAAASGSNLADKTTTEVALGNVQDAIGELLARTNAAMGKLGLPVSVNNGGGTAPDGTINSISIAPTGATTGAPVAGVNAFITAANTALYNVATQINRIAIATGVTPAAGSGYIVVIGWKDTPLATIPLFVTNTGIAASPATTQAEAIAALTALRNNVATLSATLNTAVTGYTTAMLVCVL